MLTSLSLLSLVPFAIAQTPPLPEKGDNGEMGGIFGMGKINLSGGLPAGISIGGFPNGPEFPKPGPRNTSKWMQWELFWGDGSNEKIDGGSGPYKAGYTTDPTLPKHTIFAPLVAPPASVKVPVIVWGNGG